VSRRENWTSLVSGGECIVKQYVYFTHVCTVSNYLPTVDYCCCVRQDLGLLCCRYHQGWNQFAQGSDYLNHGCKHLAQGWNHLNLGWNHLNQG